MLPNVLIEAQNKVINDLNLIKLSSIINRIFLDQAAGLNTEEKTDTLNYLWELRANLERINEDANLSLILSAWDLDTAINRDSIILLLATIRNTDVISYFRQRTGEIQPFLRMKVAADALIKSTEINNRFLYHDLNFNDERFSTVNFEIVLGHENGLRFESFALIISSLEGLFLNVSLLFDKPLDKPEIQFIESGSDILIGIKGAKETVQFIIGAFRFYYKFIKNMEFLAQQQQSNSALAQLAVNREIHEQAKSGYIDPERAEKLSEKVVSNIDKLYSENVVLADYHNEDTSPKKLLVAKHQQLLARSSEEMQDDKSV
jgi:hypothetical protein